MYRDISSIEIYVCLYFFVLEGISQHVLTSNHFGGLRNKHQSSDLAKQVTLCLVPPVLTA